MKLRSLVVGCVAVLLWALAVSAQSARPQQQTPAQPQRTPAAAPAPVRVEPASGSLRSLRRVV